MSSFSAFPSDWNIKDLRDIPIAIIDGDRGKNYPAKEEFTPEGFCLFLNTGNIKNDSFDFTNCEFVTESRDAMLRKGKLSRNDIVLTTRGTVGSIGYFHRGIQHDHVRINSGMVILRCSSSLFAPYFYQLFKSQTLKTQFELYSSGSAQPQLPIKDLRRVKLPFPKRATQGKIAAILWSYDNLIENNKRRITLLEKLADEIYREWFVRLRFPGHGAVKITKRVPQGWKFAKIGDLVSDEGLLTGKRPKGGAEDSGVPSIGAENVIGLAQHNFAKEKYVSEQFYEAMRQGHVRDRDILFYKDGADIGRVTLAQDSFPHEKCCVNEHVFIIRTANSAFQYFLLFYLKQSMLQEYVKTINKNAAQPGINQTELRSIPVLLPHENLLPRFNEIVSPILQQLFALAKANRTLEKVRGVLLPRLISGKLSVENLDIQFPPGMAEELNAEPTATAHA